MELRKGDGFIAVGTTFMEMEEKFLVWLSELDQLREKCVEGHTRCPERDGGQMYRLTVVESSSYPAIPPALIPLSPLILVPCGLTTRLT
jgi:hypothetical protein